MTLASYISVARVFLIPVFLYFFVHRGGRVWSVAVLLLAGASDMLDGYLARSRNEISTLGKILDPVADKLMVISAVAALMVTRELPDWLGFALFFKELALVIGGARYYLTHQELLSASYLGKGATVVLYIGIISTILRFPAGVYLVSLGFIISLIAGLDYFIKSRHA
ncbi:MAG: CDP-alcohol phosphatidyltransferase family protein [Firmicutes bacterium]|nr:CDP-alcohol phosphatidyltransferase family protein [Bacillota bacterium]